MLYFSSGTWNFSQFLTVYHIVPSMAFWYFLMVYHLCSKYHVFKGVFIFCFTLAVEILCKNIPNHAK